MSRFRSAPHLRGFMGALFVLLATGRTCAARDLATDRPDVTESPVPVERGRWQLEMDALAVTKGEDGARSAQLAVLNLKRGLDASTDLQLLITPVTLERAPDAVGGGREVGPVAFGVRLKHNLWGADSGTTALGLLPWLTWQSGSAPAEETWSVGLAVPFSAALGAGLGVGTMLQAVSVHEGSARNTQWTATASASRALAGPLSGYLEWVATASVGALEAPSTLASLGLTYRVSDDLQLDAGVRTGLVRDPSDTVFAGMAVRR